VTPASVARTVVIRKLRVNQKLIPLIRAEWRASKAQSLYYVGGLFCNSWLKCFGDQHELANLGQTHSRAEADRQNPEVRNAEAFE
jgi:hypothetical protein